MEEKVKNNIDLTDEEFKRILLEDVMFTKEWERKYRNLREDGEKLVVTITVHRGFRTKMENMLADFLDRWKLQEYEEGVPYCDYNIKRKGRRGAPSIEEDLLKPENIVSKTDKDEYLDNQEMYQQRKIELLRDLSENIVQLVKNVTQNPKSRGGVKYIAWMIYMAEEMGYFDMEKTKGSLSFKQVQALTGLTTGASTYSTYYNEYRTIFVGNNERQPTTQEILIRNKLMQELKKGFPTKSRFGLQ